jgi:hypothetical protein
MFFRESSTRLYVDLRVGQNLLPVTFASEPGFDPDTGAALAPSGEVKLFPTEFTLSIGMGF